jgi:hypothetical protein
MTRLSRTNLPGLLWGCASTHLSRSLPEPDLASSQNLFRLLKIWIHVPWISTFKPSQHFRSDISESLRTAPQTAPGISSSSLVFLLYSRRGEPQGSQEFRVHACLVKRSGTALFFSSHLRGYHVTMHSPARPLHLFWNAPCRLRCLYI